MRLQDILRRAVVVASILSMAAVTAATPKTDRPDARPLVLMAAIEGPIGPAMVHHVNRVTELAAERRAAAIVFRINTPGGLADAMREVISGVLQSTVPVIGYVAPPGAHAASAGTYILYATHVAAMAPGTNLGAATPVPIGGLPGGLPEPEGGSGDRDSDRPDDESAAEDEAAPGAGPAPSDPMTAKATNDAVALIRSLAELHGRNAEWAERAVREAASLSSAAALELGVIDLVARDVDELLRAADGRTVEVAGAEQTLALADAAIETVEMNAITRVLSVISNPNIALVLMMIGIYGLVFEFWNPGAIGPGVIGAISLTLGLYALNQLPLDYAGLALLGLGIAFMVVESLTPAFGVLGIGGLIAFVIGASMLIDTDVPAYQISWWMIGTMAAVSGAVLVLVLGLTIRAYRGVPVSGRARMIGSSGPVLEWSGSGGFVWIEGERWRAEGATGLTPGQTVEVREIDGLTLLVAPARE